MQVDGSIVGDAGGRLNYGVSLPISSPVCRSSEGTGGCEVVLWFGTVRQIEGLLDWVSVTGVTSGSSTWAWALLLEIPPTCTVTWL